MNIDEIVSAHYQKIYKLCLFYLGNQPQEAEEICHDIFVKIMCKLDTFKGDANIYTWCYRLAVNTLINHLKRKKIVEFISFEKIVAYPRETDLSEPLGADPAQALEEKEKKREILTQLKKALTSLSLREKTAFYLFFYDNLKQKEIADIMNTSVSAVEALIHKAKKKIKARMPDC